MFIMICSLCMFTIFTSPCVHHVCLPYSFSPYASARPPAFLSTTPHIPSSLEGTRSRKALNGYRLLNVANDLGQNWDSHCWVCLSQSEAFLPLGPGCSDVAHEHDVTLHIKGECVHTLEALGTWSLSWRLRAL